MIQVIFLQNNAGRNDGGNIFYDFRFSFVRNKKYCLKSCSYYFPFCVICSLKSTNVPLAETIGISNLSISILKEHKCAPCRAHLCHK